MPLRWPLEKFRLVSYLIIEQSLPTCLLLRTSHIILTGMCVSVNHAIVAHAVAKSSYNIIIQGRQRRCGWCGHGRTTFSGTLRNSFCQLNLFSNSGCIVGFSASLEVPLQLSELRGPGAVTRHAYSTPLHMRKARSYAQSAFVYATRMYARA